MRTWQVCSNLRGGGQTTSIENSEGWESIKEHMPWRAAAVLGILTKDNKIQENIPSKDRSRFNCERYKFFLDAPFEISSNCCSVMKKRPIHNYAKKTGRKPMTAQMASESRLRTQQWLKNGCNGFDMKSPISNPMSFWTEQDVLLYIRENNLPICSVYGDVVTDDEESGQMTLADISNLGIFDIGRPFLHTTGCSRTGCMFCGYGCHLEKGVGRFERMKITHPKQYAYLFRGGEWEYRIFDRNGEEINLRHCAYHQIDGWVKQNEDNPNFVIERAGFHITDGLGYKEVIDWINEHGNLNIKY